MSEPWGHKVTLVAYVPGGIETAKLASQEIANAADRPWVSFAGARIDVVQDEPRDQVAS